MALNAKKTAFYLLIILAIAVFFRFFELKTTPPGLYPDEAMNGNNAIEALTTHQFKVFYPENNGREGLFMNIQAVFLSLIGQNEPWILRLPSAIFGIFTVLGIYFLASLIFKNKNIGLLTAFIMAVSFWHINFSRIGFRAITAPFFLVWASYFFIRSLETEIPKQRVLDWFFGGIFFGLGFYSYIAYRPMPLLILIIAWLYWLQNKNSPARRMILKTTVYFAVIAFIVALPLGIYFLNHPGDFFGRTSEISIFSSPTPLKDLGLNILKISAMFNVAGDNNWRHNLAGAPELFWPIGLMFLFGFGLALKKLFKRNADKISKKAAIIIFTWLILAALSVVISNEGLPHALRAILTMPPIFMLAAWGGWELYEWLIKKQISKKLLLVATSILFLFVIVQTYKNYFVDWGQNQATRDAFSSNYVMIGRELNALPQSLPKYVIIQADGTLVHGLPMPAQTVMFITNTYLPQDQKIKNIFYVLPNQLNQIPVGAFTVKIQ